MFKKIIFWFMPIIASFFIIGCGGSGQDAVLGHSASDTSIAPTVIAVAPLDGETNVSRNIQSITAEFSIPMNATTLTASSFTLFKGAVQVTGGSVAYDNRVAELNVTTVLDANATYTATITTAAKSATGVALANNYVWTFTTGATSDTTAPTVISTSPRNGDLNVSITKIITATFSEAMKALSITTAGTFTVKDTNTSVNVPGTTTYSVINQIASFKPTSNLAADTNYTAIITTAAKDLAGNAMASDYNWTFKTAAGVPSSLVDFGLAATYGIAATAGITNTANLPRTQIDGNVVLNPTATCNAVAVDGAGGIGLCGGPAMVPLISGTVVSKTPPFPDATTAQNVTDDLRAAYLAITPANMPGGTNLPAGTTLGAPIGNPPVLNDNLFYSGVYHSGTSILITGDLTLDAQNNPNATFVFQSFSTIGTAAGARILLVNGAKASNVYWQAGSSTTLGTNTIWNGNILSYASITMNTGATSCGRLFAGAFTAGAFVFDANRVSVPGDASAPGTCQ